MSDSQELERRYRRLLAWYPAEHRRVHSEEMIGVLLASAGQGQRRPSLADTLDLIKGGLQARLRRGRYEGGDIGWRDTFAVTSVTVPATLAMTWVVGIVIWAFTARSRIPAVTVNVGDLIPLIVPLMVIPLVAMLFIVLPPLAALRYLERTSAAGSGRRAAAPTTAFRPGRSRLHPVSSLDGLRSAISISAAASVR